MKRDILLISFLLCLGLSDVLAGQPDPRFDGRWVGVEDISGYFVHNQLGGGQKPGEVSAVIAIGDSGKTLGVVKGLTAGRYNVSPKSDGNTLIFKLESLHSGHGHGFLGRTDGKLVLSGDGNTLTETGHAILPGWPRNVNCIIKGTFHRRSKK